MIRLDTRLTRQSNGDENLTPTNESPSDFAPQLELVLSVYQSRFTGVFEAAGKSLRYGLEIVGPDHPDSTSTDKFITRNADPDWYLTGTLFRGPELANTRDWFEETFDLMSEELETEELPKPDLFVTDIESENGGPFPYTAGSNTGWFEPALTDITDLGTDVTPSQTLAQFLDGRGQIADGSAWDPYDPDETTPAPFDRTVPQDHPKNWERSALAGAQARLNYSHAMDNAIYAPFKSAFGNIPCAEWCIISHSQEHQAKFAPGRRQHFCGPDIAVDYQVIINYGSPTNDLKTANSTSVVVYPDSRWGTFYNFLAAFPQVGPTPPMVPSNVPITAEASVSEQWQRLALELRLSQAEAAVKTAPEKRLLPCIAPAGETLDQKRQTFPYMIRFMLETIRLGAEQFWVFAAGWNDSSVTRDSTHELIDGFNRAFQARIPRRNHVQRRVM